MDADRLNPADQAHLEAILQTLEPVITFKRQDGSAILLTWEALYAPLTNDQRTFLETFRALRGQDLGATAHYFGELAEPVELVLVGPHTYWKDGVLTPVDPQYLPRPAFDAYERMMQAMEDDLGQRLLVESGYRSAAYQLYLFLFYLPKHGYSVRETNRFVALPGHSEHGWPPSQAIDFINVQGVNGEDNPEAFEALPEYQWLTRRASEFGFVLSYPRDNPSKTAFEPWHWHFERNATE